MSGLAILGGIGQGLMQGSQFVANERQRKDAGARQDEALQMQRDMHDAKMGDVARLQKEQETTDWMGEQYRKEVMGARLNGELVGFAIFVDLPEPVSGMRCGMVDHIYVHHDHRQKGIAKAIVDLLADQAEERGWSKLILNAPRQPEDGRKLYEQIAAPSDWTSWIIRFDGR